MYLCTGHGPEFPRGAYIALVPSLPIFTRCPGALKWTTLAAPLPITAIMRPGSSGLGLRRQMNDFSTFKSVLRR